MTAAEFKKSAGSIFDSTLGGSAATIIISGISATYAHLMVSLYARSDVAAASTAVLMQFNGDAAANYDYQELDGIAAATSAGELFATSGLAIGTAPANTASANLFNAAEIFIPNYAGTSNNKQFVSINSHKTGTTTGLLRVSVFGGGWRSVAAINQITLLTAGNFVAGTRVTVHALGA